MKAQFIRSIGRCYVNSIGFDLYENADKSATVRPNRLGNDFPHKHFLKFESLEAADDAIERIAGDTEGAARVHALKQVWL